MHNLSMQRVNDCYTESDTESEQFSDQEIDFTTQREHVVLPLCNFSDYSDELIDLDNVDFVIVRSPSELKEQSEIDARIAELNKALLAERKRSNELSQSINDCTRCACEDGGEGVPLWALNSAQILSASIEKLENVIKELEAEAAIEKLKAEKLNETQ